MHLIELAELLERVPDLEPAEPHPDLTASIRPSAADVFAAAQRLGWLPAEPFLRPVVAAHAEE